MQNTDLRHQIGLYSLRDSAGLSPAQVVFATPTVSGAVVSDACSSGFVSAGAWAAPGVCMVQQANLQNPSRFPAGIAATVWASPSMFKAVKLCGEGWEAKGEVQLSSHVCAVGFAFPMKCVSVVSRLLRCSGTRRRHMCGRGRAVSV